MAGIGSSACASCYARVACWHLCVFCVVGVWTVFLLKCFWMRLGPPRIRPLTLRCTVSAAIPCLVVHLCWAPWHVTASIKPSRWVMTLDFSPLHPLSPLVSPSTRGLRTTSPHPGSFPRNRLSSLSRRPFPPFRPNPSQRRIPFVPPPSVRQKGARSGSIGGSIPYQIRFEPEWKGIEPRGDPRGIDDGVGRNGRRIPAPPSSPRGWRWRKRTRRRIRRHVANQQLRRSAQRIGGRIRARRKCHGRGRLFSRRCVDARASADEGVAMARNQGS